jgi:hypothetical protein
MPAPIIMTPMAIIPAAPVPVRGNGPEGGGCVAAVLLGSTVVDTVPPSVVTLPAGAVDEAVGSVLLVEVFSGVVVDVDGAVVILEVVVDDEPVVGVVVDDEPEVVVVVAFGFVVTVGVVVVGCGTVVVAPGTVVVFAGIAHLWLKTTMPSDVQFLPS